MPARINWVLKVLVATNKKLIVQALVFVMLASSMMYFEVDNAIAETLAYWLNLGWQGPMWNHRTALLTYGLCLFLVLGAVILQRRFRIFNTNRVA